VTEFVEFAPTKVVIPALEDAHPDHRAMALFGMVAAWESRRAIEKLAYVIHKGPRPLRSCEKTYSLSIMQQTGKRDVLEIHQSQLEEGRPFLMSFVTPEEMFFDEEAIPLPLGDPSKMSPIAENSTGITVDTSYCRSGFYLFAYKEGIPFAEMPKVEAGASEGRFMGVSWSRLHSPTHLFFHGKGSSVPWFVFRRDTPSS